MAESLTESPTEHFIGRGSGPTEGIKQQLEQLLKESGITSSVAQRFQEDLRFLSRNESKLGRQFPDRWIAIKSFTVLAAKNTHDKLLEALKDMGEKPGLVLRWFLQRVNASPSVQFLNYS